MIKLTRHEKPDVLSKNEYSWLCNLKVAISAYGSYKNIPKDQKEKLTVHYRHEDIKASLFESSLYKCAFCECKPSEGGNIEVEHFKPKSVYPDFTFDWINFLPACRKCNGNKLDHDTVKEPIVNPYEMNPEDVFEYNEIRIASKQGANKDIGNKTIEICGLNSVRLMQPRANILVDLYAFSDSLDEAIADYNEASTPVKKQNRARKINEAIERIEQLQEPNERYSGFCRHFLQNCSSYKEAKRLISSLAA